MKRFKFSRLFAAAVIVASITLSACTPTTGDNPSSTVTVNNGTPSNGTPAGGQQGGGSQENNGGNQGGQQNGGNPAGQNPQTPALPNGVSALTASTNVVGTWASASEKFEIQTSVFKNFYANSGSWTESYTGDNLCVKYTDEAQTAGYIYMKYTKAMNPDYSYSTTAPDVGKWYAIAFKDLNASAAPNTIKLAGAYKNGGQTSTATLEAAITEFTIENGYFGWFSDLQKQ